jgi:tripartite motif-containing protein 71
MVGWGVSRVRRMGLVCWVVCMVAGCGGSGGSGVSGVAKDGMFGSYGTEAGEFVEPNGIGVDQGSGDVFVLDSNNSRVEKFTPDGKLLLGWGWGVADGKTRALQTCSAVCHAGFEGAGPGQLQFAEGVAVDNDPSSSSRGDVYIVDIGNHRVEKFTADGRFVWMIGGGVNQTAVARHERANEDLCPVHPGDRCAAAVEGRLLDFAVEGSFIAVGPRGTLYLGQRDKIVIYTAAGRYENQVKLPTPPGDKESHELGGVSGLAVNASGDMYVIQNGMIGVREYAPSGRLLRIFEQHGPAADPEGPTPTLTLSPAGELFVDVNLKNAHRIDEYSAKGAKLATLDTGAEDGLHGIAYSEPAHKLYIVNANSNTKPPIAHVHVIPAH